MSDLLFYRLAEDTLDLEFGAEVSTEAPEEVLGEYDLLFSSEPTQGNNLLFGFAVEGDETSYPELTAGLSLKVYTPTLHILAENIRQMVRGILELEIPLVETRLKSAYDINTFQGFTRSAGSRFTDSKLVYEKIINRLQEAVQTFTTTSSVFHTPLTVEALTFQSFQEGYLLAKQTATFFEVGQPVKVYNFPRFEEAEPISVNGKSLFQQAEVVPALVKGQRFQEGLIESNQFGSLWQQAIPLSRQFGFSTHYSQPVNTSFEIAYEAAEYPVNVLPPKVPPPKPVVDPDKNAYDYDLFFHCLPDEGEAPQTYYDLIFNNCWNTNPSLGVDYTEPYFVINSIELINVETGEFIHATGIDFSTDQSSFAWSGSMSVSAQEVSKLVSPTNAPVKVALTFNGNLAVLMVQRVSKTSNFNSHTYRVDLISPTALLDDPYSRVDSRTVTEDASPQALIEPMLSTLVTGITLDWQYLSVLDWTVAANTFTYQELSPVKAIGKLLEGSAAFMYSSLDGETLVVKRKRANEFWEPTINPKIVDTALVTTLSFSSVRHRNFDAVYVISGLNQTAGITGHIVRDAGAGVELAPQVIAPTLTSPSAVRDAGKYVLGSAGVVETRTLNLPIVEGNHLLLPADAVSFIQDGITYVGTVLSTSVSIKFNAQYQTFVVEVVKGYA